MRLRTVLLSLVPGAAHVDLGRAGRGLLYFFLFAFLLNGALVAPFLTANRQVRVACALGAAGIWILALFGAVRTAARGSAPTPRPPEGGEAPTPPASGDTKEAGVSR